MGHSRDPAPRAVALVCTLKDINCSCRYVIELFSSSLYSSDHDTPHNLTFVYCLNILQNASKILVRFYVCFFFFCLYSRVWLLTGVTSLGVLDCGTHLDKNLKPIVIVNVVGQWESYKARFVTLEKEKKEE